MSTTDQAGVAERTAAAPAEVPAAGRLADEFTASRRGLVRRYFHDHPRVMDVVVVLVNLVLGLGTFFSPGRYGLLIPALLLLATSATLMFRRYRPVTVIIILVFLEIARMYVEPYSNNAGSSLWFGLYAVAVAYPAVFSMVTTAVISAPLILYLLFFYQYPAEFLVADGPTAQESNIITIIVLVLSNVIAVGIGMSVRRGREHEQELRSWAIRNAHLASIAERNRIAREMHDVVAHSLTVMVALSDGAAVVVKRNPDKAGEVLGQLSQTGRTALADMRRVLGVLRDDGDSDAKRAPMPDRAGLNALVDGFRHAGLPLTMTQAGPTLPDDPALQLTVYRIVQESLTNVLRYGTAVSRVQVLIDNDAPGGELRIQVADDGHGSVDRSMGTGQGIVGMRERAGIYAGTVNAGPGPQGGWVVEAVLHPSAGHP